jgi:integrase/transposase
MAGRPSHPWFYVAKNTWYVWLDGKKASLKVKGEGNKAEALKAWHRLMANVTPEPLGQPLPTAMAMASEPEGMTVAEVLTAFLADCEGRIGRKSLHDYRAFLTAFARTFGTVKASALTTAQAEIYARKPTWSASTQHDFLGILSAAFKWAERTRLIERTPLVGLRKPPKASRGMKSIVSADTVSRLLAFADAQGDTEFSALLRFLWLTGCRPSEASGLTTDAVHWEQKCAVLERHKTAHLGRVRVIYLSEEALAILREQQKEHPQGFLFRRPSGGKWTTHSITGKFARMCRAKQVRKKDCTCGLTGLSCSSSGGDGMSQQPLTLSPWQRRQLQRLRAQTQDARLYRRTLAVLEIARGTPIARVARTLGASRRAVYYWVEDYAERHDPADLVPGHGPGRPTAWTEEARALLQELLAGSPAARGYYAVNWTVPLLQEELRHGTGGRLSDDTIRRELRRLGYVWKRPRYVLASDPELEKKTADPPANRGPAAPQRPAGRRRDRPAAVPAAAGQLVVAGAAGAGVAVGEERPPGGLRHDEPLDG